MEVGEQPMVYLSLIHISSHYDSAIFNYFDGGEGSAFRCAVEEQKQLRYGENPHPVSYTHLDVYKRQIQCLAPSCWILMAIK